MAGTEGSRAQLLPDRWLHVMPESFREPRIVGGDGARVWDDDGRSYLDLRTGGGMNVLGHAHPGFVAAIDRQVRALDSADPGFDIDAREEFVEALSVAMPNGLSAVVITSSGSEAVDAAVMLACSVTRRGRVVAMTGASHGTTMLAAALSDDGARAAATAVNVDVARAAYDDFLSLERVLDRSIAAVVVEPVQWGREVREPRSNYLAQLLERCRDAGALLVVDEVTTGLRAWPPLSSTRRGITPDVVCLGTSLANGFPIGAAVLSETVADTPSARVLSGSAAGHPVACVAGAATLRALADPAIRTQVNDNGPRLQSRLRALRMSEIRDVRGEGTIASLELHADTPAVVRALRELGVLVRQGASGDIRLMPPTVIERRDVDEVVEKIAAAILESRRSRRRRRAEEPADVELRGVVKRPRKSIRSDEQTS